MRLSDLKPGQTAIILKVLGHGAFRKRILEMGFIHGKKVEAVLDAPLKDPVKYKIMDYEVSLRRSEAAMIEVITEKEAISRIRPHEKGQIIQDNVEAIVRKSKRQINIALVGNPNSGKTSLFNAASGSHQHVGNYSGVTVDAKRGTFTHKGYKFNIYDLPGTYALSAYSPEEVYVRRHLVEGTPDVVVNVVAASNLERNLYLTTELIDMDCTMVMALNMYDELEKSGAVLDYDALGSMLGMPIIPTVSRTGKGIEELFDAVIEVYENKSPKTRHIHITHNNDIEDAIIALEKAMKSEGSISEYFSTRYLAIKLLERDKEIEDLLRHNKNYPDWLLLRDQLIQSIERKTGEDLETTITNEKYGFISGAIKETLTPGSKEETQTTRIIDSFVTNKLFGFPIFLILMWLMFEATFRLGAYPMEWIETAVGWLGELISDKMADGMLKDLIVDGIIGGVGGVIVFLPNILILYLFISFMEDSGYMARAAFIMDKIMHRMGLHGKSFIPLIMGFGCNVPAIMATRSIESKSSRLITILINPFMSCSARLPVYVLLIAAFFPQYGSWVMLGLYALGILMAVITARLMRRFWFKKDETPFVMELPPYRMPTLRSILSHMWDKGAQYLRKMGGIILVASIVVWFLSYFPRHNDANIAETQQTELSFENQGEPLQQDEPSISEEYLQQKNSYLGRIGQSLSPLMSPLGFNWKINIALLTGAAAKELVVSTLGVLYANDAEAESHTLSQRLHAPNPETGVADLNSATALSLLVFVLLYFPCFAAIAAIRKETGSWRWTAFSFIYNTLVAWIVAFIVYRIALLFI